VKYEDIFDIDDLDKELIKILQDTPDITHPELAEKLQVSQSDIGEHITKLRTNNVISSIIGIDCDKLDTKVARIDIYANNADQLWERLNQCPCVSNCFKTSEKNNIILEITASNVKIIDNFVDTCLRKDPNIVSLQTNFIVNSVRHHVIPLSLEIEKNNFGKCQMDCSNKFSKEATESIYMHEY
jgi:DNA-binding Lrp family transcriptional regulator